ncbi:hypothetical protein C1645_810494 [Glomus cerebriforme]|uniref:BTB/POZ domain-containing protein n=1 Tax=Glomus cerebriforme TaxID=658196 RepID=A0A397S6I5_9GLOM|nr:hypothetical protein C1645_810494 [Glomus cerebriforme]
MQQKLCTPVLNNFEKLFKSKKDYDVIIKSGEDDSQKEIYAHSVVLCCQSNYFDAALSDNWAEKENGKYIFKKPNISPHILENVIRYLYCGQLDLNTKNGLDVLKLLVATEELGLNTLCDYIQEFLIENQEELLQNDTVGILEFAFQHETFTKLKDHCLETICQNPDILFGTDKILSLPVHILESLLEREDLVLDEIDIWNDLITWAHAQQPTVNKDPSEWTKDDVTLMENTLLRMIHLIRFHDIPSKEYYNKVVPYENLLPKQLKSEIMKYYLASDIIQIGSLPSRSSNIKVDSVIINTQHLALFAGWIDRKNVALKKNPYKFNLIFRASRDGNTPEAFHRKCDNKGATIVVVKIKGTKRLVGGYNPLDWVQSSSYTKNTQESFIFHFNDYRDTNTGKIGRVINAANALICNNSWGPIFGNTFTKRSYDLVMNSDCKWKSTPSDYPNLHIPKKFRIKDFEVFQIVKR